MSKCFVVMPITTPARFLEQYWGDQDHFAHVFEHLFCPAIEACGFEVIDPRAQGADVIHANIIQNIENADMVLCDMSCLNPNVFFELGVRTALNKPVCLVRDDLTESVPFDLGVINHHTYSAELNVWDLKEEIQRLGQHFQKAIASGRNVNSLWKYFSISSTTASLQSAASNSDRMDYLIRLFESLREDINLVSKQQRMQILERRQSPSVPSKFSYRSAELVEALRDARRATGLTVTEICELAKVDRISVARLEQGAKTRRSTALRICKILNVDPGLVWWKDPSISTEATPSIPGVSAVEGITDAAEEDLKG